MPDKPIETWENYRYEVVPLQHLFVDQDYQRRLTNFAKAIARNWVPPLVNTLVVSARKENAGKLVSGAVIDGQTRLEGARMHNDLVNAEDSEIEGGTLVLALPCIVYSDLSKPDEAQLFEWLQTQRKSVPTFDRYRASLVAGNEESMAMKEIVESAGYEIGYPGMSSVTLTAVSALRAMMRRDVIAFERTLVVFKEAWKTNYLPSGWQLRGMFRFLRENPDIDDEKLVRRMFITSPYDLDRKAQAAKEVGGNTASDVYMAQAIASIYAIREAQVQRKLEVVS